MSFILTACKQRACNVYIEYNFVITYHSATLKLPEPAYLHSLDDLIIKYETNYRFKQLNTVYTGRKQHL